MIYAQKYAKLCHSGNDTGNVFYPALEVLWSDIEQLCLSGTWLHAGSAQGVTCCKILAEYFYGNRADLNKKTHAANQIKPQNLILGPL